MNLETRLDSLLWDAIRVSYESKNYRAAILDAVHCLTDIIRDRSSLEGDGVALVGAAFGGSSPRLKVNRLQTESEQNIQRGVEALLRGVYQAIRNPRSHESVCDSEQDCAAIVLFVDYLIRIVGTAQSPFSLQACVARVLDPDFVPKPRYAQVIISRIPERKRLAVCLEVLRRRSEANASKVRCFFKEVIATFTADDKSELIRVISDSLLETDEDATVRFVLQVLPSDLWPEIDEAARLRIEHKLIQSVESGKVDPKQRRCRDGALGTWITNIAKQISLKADLWAAIARKLRSSDPESQDYAFEYFVPHAPAMLESPPRALEVAIRNGLKAGDLRFKAAVENWTTDLLPFDESFDAWTKPFAEDLAAFQEASPTPNGDDIPF